MSSSMADIVFLTTADQCGFVMEKVWRGLWEVMAANAHGLRSTGQDDC